MLSFREATLRDASICEEIIDLQEKSFDPAAHGVGPVHVREILSGYFSEVHSELFTVLYKIHTHMSKMKMLSGPTAIQRGYNLFVK